MRGAQGPLWYKSIGEEYYPRFSKNDHFLAHLGFIFVYKFKLRTSSLYPRTYN